MLIVSSDDHRRHHCLELDGGVLIPSWEGPDRAESIDTALASAGFDSPVEPLPFDEQLVERVHDPEYIEFLSTAWPRWQAAGNEAAAAMAFGWPGRRFRPIRPRDLNAQLGFYSFAADCSIVAGTWAAVRASAATADTAARHVAGTGMPAFARCRPPGHHAMRDQFGGYCYVNNAAVAAERLIDLGAARVAILDVDYHHGNGTQDIFYGRDDVIFCSIHADPLDEFPYFLGHRDETGDGPGEGSNLNLPLPLGTGTRAWFEQFDRAARWIRASGAEMLVVSLGVDTFELDPISQFRLDRADFAELGRRIVDLDLPTVLVMEGGYATEDLGRNVVEVLLGFGGG